MKSLLVICAFFFGLNANAQLPQTFRVKSVEGKLVTLPTFGQKQTALVFLSPDCPLSRNYALVLNELQESHIDVLNVVGVFVGPYYSKEELVAFRNKYAIKFQLVRDEKEALLNYTKATITPEVFLYSTSGALAYKGAIDDWAISLGKKRTKVSRHYLRDAVNHVTARQAVVPAETKAVGCFISTK